MAGTRITFDGLWRCLCPSVDRGALIRAIDRPLRSRRPPARPLLLLPGSPARQTRPYAGEVRQLDRLRHREARSWEPHKFQARSRRAKGPYDVRGPPELVALLRARWPYGALLRASPVEAVYEALRRLREYDGEHQRAVDFARHLLDERGEPPSAFLYESLIRANCDREGSAEGVRQALREMKGAGVEGNASLYHGALRALAVHPDYLTRNSVLKEMKDKWIDLTAEGMQSVALGLLRERQYEMALDQLESMAEQGHRVSAWVLDVFVYALGQAGFHDEALRVVNHRLLREDDKVAPVVWYFLLNACSRAFHYEGVKYVWSRAVRPGRLNPPDGMCLDVLNAASRRGDAELAGEALQHMSARGTRLGAHHFEALLDCHAGAGRVALALEALCIMHAAGVATDGGTTRSVYLCLRRGDPSLADAALAALFDLKERYGEVPVAALNVVVEALLAAGDAERAFDLYRHVRRVCPAGPDLATFRLLLEGCRDARLLAFVVDEMEAFSATVRPDEEVRDLMVSANARHGSLDTAIRVLLGFINASGGSGGGDTALSVPWVRRETAELLVRRCFEEEDSRVWEIAEASRARGFPLDDIIQDVSRDVSKRRMESLIESPSEPQTAPQVATF